MAAQTGLKRTRFAHDCHRLTNRTPLQHLNHLRVQRAQALIRADPRRSLTDVAFDCGLAPSQYFATAFRRTCGVPPREYRQAQN